MTSATESIFLLCLLGIVGTTALGWRWKNFPAIVNGIVALVAALTPSLLELGGTHFYGAAITLHPSLSVWIAGAGFLHMLGMLGWYDAVSGWDHLTHTVSAALVAAFVYASFLTSLQHSPTTPFDEAYAALFTILFTLGAGVFWELIELAARAVGEYIDRPPVLEYYGPRDTVLDMVFNGVGAVVVVGLDVRIFVSVTRQAPGLVSAMVVWGTIVLFVGMFGLALVLERYL